MRRYVVDRPARLDRIAREIYGTENGGTVEQLLAVNPGLADFAVEVPIGREILVPENVRTDQLATRPWI